MRFLTLAAALALIAGSAHSQTLPTPKFGSLTLAPLIVTIPNAGANGYIIEQDLTYNLPLNATGIYFGNQFNAVVNGDPRSGAQVWNNLDRMFAETANTSTANLVNRDIQFIRPFGFGTPKQTLWGLIVDMADQTGLDSAHGGGALGLELDLEVSDGDNSPDVIRQGLVVVLGQGKPGAVSPQATSAVAVFNDGDPAANFKSTVLLASAFHDAAVDLRSSTTVAGGTTHALWLASGLDVALDTPGSNTINYNSSLNSIALNQSSTVLFYANVAGAHSVVPLTADAAGIGLSLSGTGAMLLSSGTTAQEPDTGNAGELRYNTTTSRFEFGVGGSWINHVRLSGDTMTGALHMGANTLDGSAVAFTGGTLSGLTSVAITGAGTGLNVTNNATVGGLLGVSSASVSAAGTTQGTATALAAQTNIITAAASGTGVVVPASAPLMRVSNRAPNPVLVFPNSGAQIEAFGTNNPVSLGVGADVVIGCTSSTQCRAYP